MFLKKHIFSEIKLSTNYKTYAYKNVPCDYATTLPENVQNDHVLGPSVKV